MLQLLILPTVAFACVQHKIIAVKAESARFEFIAAAVLGYILLFLLTKSVCYIPAGIVAKIKRQAISPAIVGANILLLGAIMNVAAWIIVSASSCCYLLS